MARSSLYAQVTDGRGNGLPVPVGPAAGNDKAGYPPDRLDAVIETLICDAESGAALVERYTPMLGALMQELEKKVQMFLGPPPPPAADGTVVEPPAMGEVLKYANQVSLIIERLHKMTNLAVKSKDDASRLRSFLAGDQDRGDLNTLSENQLRKMVSDAASGWQKPDREESP